MLLIRDEDGKLRTNWFMKETSSGLLLNYFSNHPHHMKVNVAKNFIYRVCKLSDETFLNSNFEKIKKILIKNNYPEYLIDSLIRNVNNRIDVRHDNNITNNINNKKYTSMTFIKGISNKIKNQLNKYNKDLQIAFKSTNTLKTQIFTNTKNKIIHDYKSNVVYKIECNDCQASYIGETSKKLLTRVKQHKNDYRTKEGHNRTAMITHVKETGHTFNYDSAKILENSVINRNKRQLLESTHIKLHNSSINKKTDTLNIPNSYNNILQQYKNTSPKYKQA